MNRVTTGALWLVAFMLALANMRRARQWLGAYVLEQIEHVFDAVEQVLHPA